MNTNTELTCKHSDEAKLNQRWIHKMKVRDQDEEEKNAIREVLAHHLTTRKNVLKGKFVTIDGRRSSKDKKRDKQNKKKELE